MRKLALSGIVVPMGLLFLAGSALWQCTPQQKQMSDDEKIAAILDSLTVKEKARLLVGTGMHFDLPEGFEQIIAEAMGQAGGKKEAETASGPDGNDAKPTSPWRRHDEPLCRSSAGLPVHGRGR